MKTRSISKIMCQHKTLILCSLILLLYLVSCNEKEDNSLNSSSSYIDHNGGTLTSHDNVVSIFVPPNTVKESTLFSIEESNEKIPIENWGNAIGKVYHLSSSESELLNEVKITISYDQLLTDIIDEGNIGVVHWDDKGLCENVSVKKIEGRHDLQFSLGSFSFLSLINYAENDPWKTYNFRWGTKVIKWYLEDPPPPPNNEVSYLTPNNIQIALDAWRNNTSSFCFQRVYNREEANIIFQEKYYIIKEEIDALCGWYTNTYSWGVICYGFNPGSQDQFRELYQNHRMQIFLASGKASSLNINGFQELIAHEIGHALGIAHSKTEDRSKTIMCSTYSTGQTFTGIRQWDLEALHNLYSPATDHRLEVVVDNLEFPTALFLDKGKLYFTETADQSTSIGGKRTLKYYDLQTRQTVLLKDRPDNADAMVVIGNKIYLSSWQYSIPGEQGSVSVYDISSNSETQLCSIEIATRGMCLDSNNNFYVLGSSDLSDANSLYRFLPSDYSKPEVFLTGLGRSSSIMYSGGYIYYADPGTIWRIEESKERTEIYSTPWVDGMALVDNYLYYSDLMHNLICRVNILTKEDQILFENISAGKMVLDESARVIYVIDYGTVNNEYKDGKILRISNLSD